MTHRSKFDSLYRKLVIASGKNNSIPVPQSVQRYYINLTGYEYAEAVRNFVGNKTDILIIGDGGGRDYYYLKMCGKRVVAMDIAHQKIIPDLIIGDAVNLPFKKSTFDAVVCMEVIEHLFDDVKTLGDIREVLKDDGVLVLSVPFFHDIPEHHVRIHSPKTIRRLLEYCGYQLVEFIEKGGGFNYLTRLKVFLYLEHGLNLLTWKLFNKTFYDNVNKFMAEFDFKTGKAWNLLHRYSKAYGCFIKCVKGPHKDFATINVKDFTNMMLKE